jgi:hypothetical protein
MIENLMQADFVLFLLFLLLCSLLCSLFWLFGCCYLDFVRIQPEVDFRLYFDTEDQSHDGIIYLITGKTKETVLCQQRRDDGTGEILAQDL